MRLGQVENYICIERISPGKDQVSAGGVRWSLTK